MDDNDEEGAYDRDFYGNLPEGGEEPPLPPFRTFSFQADPAGGPGSSTGQQPTQAHGTPQDPEPQPDDVNDDTGPVLGGDEDLNEEEGEEEEGEEEKYEDEDEDEDEDEEEEEGEEEEEEEEVDSEAEDQAAGMTLQQVMDTINYQLHCFEKEHQMTRSQIRQLATRARQLAPTLPVGQQRHLTERIQGLVGDRQKRINYWLGRDSNYLLGPPPQEAAREAMSENALKQRYRGKTAAQRLAHDIPVPPGRPPVAQRTLQRYWRRPDGIKAKAKANGSDDDDDSNDDSDYDNVDEDSDEYMDYIPEQAYLSENNLPFLMGVREFDPKKYPTSDPRGKKKIGVLKDENGQPILGPRGHTLRNLPILPRRIPASIEGWRLATWKRYDDRITKKDIDDRLQDETYGRRVDKRRVDFGEDSGLFKGVDSRDIQFDEREVGRDFIKATKADCTCADIIDPQVEDNNNETPQQRSERAENARQKVFRNTVWNFAKAVDGTITGIVQPNGALGHVFHLPPIHDPDAKRARKACAKRNQFRNYALAEDGSTNWDTYAARDSRVRWGTDKRKKNERAANNSANASGASTPAAGPSTRGRGRGRGGRGRRGSAAAPIRGGSASARGRGRGANTQTTDLRRSKRSKEAETTAEPSSTTPSTAPKEDNICFRFLENEPLDRLELQALALLRTRAVHPLPGWVDTQLDQLRQGQRGTGAGGQEEENRLGPTQIFDTVEEAVRTARHAFSSDLFRNPLWREQHRILQNDPASNRILVFRSAIILLMVLRDQTGDSTIINAFNPNDQALTAMYGGDNNENYRGEFVTRVRREVDEHWRGFFPDDPQFAPGLESPSNASGGARRLSATGSQGPQEGPSPTRPPTARPRSETDPSSQPDDEDDDDDDEDEDDDDDYPNQRLTVTQRLDLEDAEKRQKQQHTQNTAQQNPTPTPNTTNNQPGPNQQHGQEDTTPKPSTGDTPRRSSRRASAAATAAIQQQTSPTRPTRSSQQQRLSDSQTDPTLRNQGFRGPQPSPGGGAGGPMIPPQRPPDINTSPRTPNGRRQAPENAPHMPPTRRSPRLQRTSQGSAQQQPRGERSPSFDLNDFVHKEAYSDDEISHSHANASSNAMGATTGQIAPGNGPTVYPSPPSASNTRNHPYFNLSQNGPHIQQQHQGLFNPYGHNDNNPFAHLHGQGHGLHDQLNQPQMLPPQPRNSVDIYRDVYNAIGGWNQQHDEEREQREQQEEADRALADILRYQQRSQDQGPFQQQQPPAAHAPPVFPPVQQPAAQAPSGAPIEATAAATAQTPPAQAPPTQEPEPEPAPQPRKPAAKKTGGGAKGKKRKASEDPTDDASTTQQQPPTKTTKTAATTKPKAAPRQKKAAQPTTRQTRAQSAAAADAAGDGGGAGGGGDAGDDKEADDAKATTKREPVKRKRGGGAAAKAPPSRTIKTRKAVKEGRASAAHESKDKEKGNGGKDSTQPGKKRKVMGTEKEEDDDMRDREDDDDGDSDYTED